MLVWCVSVKVSESLSPRVTRFKKENGKISRL